MYRLPLRNGIATRSTKRLQYALSIRPSLFCRGLSAKPVEADRTRAGKLKAYTGSAIAAGLISIGVLWALTSTPPATSNLLTDDRRFHAFTLVAKDPISPTLSLYTLQPAPSRSSSSSEIGDHNDPYAHFWSHAIWSVEFKQPFLQIARSYTPIPLMCLSSPASLALSLSSPLGTLRFLIRREHKGEMSNYLAGLSPGAQIEVRGPHVEFDVPNTDEVDEVLFLAGGTGVAPAVQVVGALLRESMEGLNGKDVKKIPRMRVLWASRSREDCVGGITRDVQASDGGWWLWWWPWRGTALVARSSTISVASETPNPVVAELQRLEKISGGCLSVEYLVDEEGTFINRSTILNAIAKTSSLTSKTPKEKLTNLVFVSGPDGFVDFVAGPRGWVEGRLAQGPVAGILGGLGLEGRGWQVVKL